MDTIKGKGATSKDYWKKSEVEALAKNRIPATQPSADHCSLEDCIRITGRSRSYLQRMIAADKLPVVRDTLLSIFANDIKVATKA